MSAINDIISERQRQISKEGWTLEHDDTHDKCEMASAAACYATAPSMVQIEREWVPPAAPRNWPWHFSWWRPSTYRRNLVKAGALIVAEIERWDRLSEEPCPYCTGKRTGLPGNACENCMNTGLKHPTIHSPARGRGMSIQDRFDDLHHQMAMEVKSALGVGAVVVTVISIHGDGPAGQMVLCDVERHPKTEVAGRLRIAADCLCTVTRPHSTKGE